jgi:hypothetical protein
MMYSMYGFAPYQNLFFVVNIHRGAYRHKPMFDARDQIGVFLANAERKYAGMLGGQGMTIVGFNDDWAYRNLFQSQQSALKLKGGFILHNL